MNCKGIPEYINAKLVKGNWWHQPTSHANKARAAVPGECIPRCPPCCTHWLQFCSEAPARCHASFKSWQDTLIARCLKPILHYVFLPLHTFCNEFLISCCGEQFFYKKSKVFLFFLWIVQTTKLLDLSFEYIIVDIKSFICFSSVFGWGHTISFDCHFLQKHKSFHLIV